MSSIIVSDIPTICTKDDLVTYFGSRLPAKGSIHYILFPLASKNYKALIECSSADVAHAFLSSSHEICGCVVKLSTAPRKTYTNITAELDPGVIASLEDTDECVQQLRKEFGVEVDVSSKLPAVKLTGSLLQIQCAQAYLDRVFQQQQRTQQEELDRIGQETPRSTYSAAEESTDLDLERLNLKLGQDGGGRGGRGGRGANREKKREDRSEDSKPGQDGGGMRGANQDQEKKDRGKDSDLKDKRRYGSGTGRKSDDDDDDDGGDGGKEYRNRQTEQEEKSAYKYKPSSRQDYKPQAEAENRGNKDEGAADDNHKSSSHRYGDVLDAQKSESDELSARVDKILRESLDIGEGRYATSRSLEGGDENEDARSDTSFRSMPARLAEKQQGKEEGGRRYGSLQTTPRTTPADDTFFEDRRYGDAFERDSSAVKEEKERLTPTEQTSQSEKERSSLPGWSATSGPENPSVKVTAETREALLSSCKSSGSAEHELPKETLTLDTLVLKYLRKFYNYHINIMEQSYGVIVDYVDGDEFTTVNIYCVDEGNERYIKQAHIEFADNYQKIFRTLVTMKVSYDTKTVTKKQRVAAVDALKKGWDSTLYIEDKDDGDVHVVGKYDFVVVVVDWLQKKLGLKEYKDYLAQSGQFGRITIDSSGQPVKISKPSTSGGVTGTTSKHTSAKGQLGARGPLGAKGPLGAQQTGKQAAGKQRVAVVIAKTGAGKKPSPKTYSSEDEDEEMFGDPETPSANLNFRYRTAEGITVNMYAANIVELATDVIVNPANESLSHIGGVALAISKAAGPYFQRACTNYVNDFGPLRITEVAATSAKGLLRCGHVIHTVGPVWGTNTTENDVLPCIGTCVLNVLTLASNTLQAKSVAFPAISAGSCGVPTDICARGMYMGILTFSRKYARHSSVREIHIVTLDHESIAVMAAVVQQYVQSEERPPRPGLGGLKDFSPDVDVADYASRHTAGTKPKKGGAGGVKHSAGKKKMTMAERLSQSSEENLKALIDSTEDERIEYKKAFEDDRKDYRKEYEEERKEYRKVYEGGNEYDALFEDYKIDDVDLKPTKEARGAYASPGRLFEDAHIGGIKSPREIITSPRAAYKSPREEIRSPLEGYKSPRSDYKSPRDDIKSPIFKSPKEGIRSPREDYRSPREDYRSPRDKIKSPMEDYKSPMEEIKSPIFKSPKEGIRSPKDYRSPREDSKSPNFKSPRGEDYRSPREEIRSPREGISSPIFKSPREDYKSPREDYKSPREDYKSPREDYKSPREDIRSPREGIKSPKEGFRSPREDMRSPREDMRSPRGDVRSPREDIKSPRGDVRSPREDIKAPRGDIKSPREDVKSPREDVKSPREDVKSPREDIKSPREDIRSPRDIKSPRDDYRSPREDIKSPREAITSPREGLKEETMSPRGSIGSSKESTPEREKLAEAEKGEGEKEEEEDKGEEEEVLTTWGQPDDGEMRSEVDRKIRIAGEDSPGAVVLTFTFPGGSGKDLEGNTHTYEKTTFVAFLPNTQPGRQVQRLIERAFHIAVLFMVEITKAGAEIIPAVPLKTQIEGGIDGDGFPDPEYLQEVKLLLAEKGVTDEGGRVVKDSSLDSQKSA